MQIIPLSEGSFTIGKDKIFHSFDLEKDDLQARPVGSLLVEVQPFCIITGDDILVIDAGLGFKKNGELQIIANLKANGIQPQQVTKVLMSHLHKDHAGGVSVKDMLGRGSLAFPNATYFVQRREYDFASEMGYPSFMPDELEALEGDSRVVWLEDNEGTIAGNIRYQVTGGHSPFHQVFWIDTEEGILFYGGDDAPQLNQMKSRFVAKYDFDGKKCMELRHDWWAKGIAEGWTFLFYHDVKNAFVKAG